MAEAPLPASSSSASGNDRRRRRRALLALGVRLARAGALAKVALVLGAVGTLAGVAGAFVLARRGANVLLTDLPGGLSTALGWVCGVLVAFSAARQALLRDRDDGLRALLAARGSSLRGYLFGRTFGLALVIGLVVVGGTLVTGATCTALAGRSGALRVAQGSGAALVYAIAFALTLAPVALAALGARSRAGGYLWLLAILVVPELVSSWTEQMLPGPWQDFTSIPGALGALRAALMPPGIDAARLGRAVVVLGAVIVSALLVVRAQLARIDADAPRAPRERSRA